MYASIKDNSKGLSDTYEIMAELSDKIVKIKQYKKVTKGEKKLS